MNDTIVRQTVKMLEEQAKKANEVWGGQNILVSRPGETEQSLSTTENKLNIKNWIFV